MSSIAIDRTDGLSSSTAIKGPCFVATTVNITLYGEQTIDGVAVVTSKRVLVKNQTNGYENGIYVADTGQWRRAKDFSRNNDVRQGTQILVANGTLFAASGWYVSNADPITIGTTQLLFVQNILLNAQQLIQLEALAAADAAAALAAQQAAVVAEHASESARDAALAVQSSIITLVNGQYPTTQRFAVGAAVQSVNLGNTALTANGIKVFINGVYQFSNTWSIAAGVVTPVGGTWPGDGVTTNMEVAVWATPGLAVAQAIPIDGSVSYGKLDPQLQTIFNSVNGPFIPATRTALKAVDTTVVKIAFLQEAGREGQFNWKTGDFSTQVAADTLEGIYIKADAIATTSGAWVRQFVGPLSVRCFGADSTGVASSDAAITAAAAMLKNIMFPVGTYKVSANLTLPADLSLTIHDGAQIQPATGTVFTFTITDIQAGNYQIFGGAGSFAGNLNNARVPAFWFGAKPNVASSQTAAIQALITFLAQGAARSGIFVTGTYRLDTGLVIPGGVHLIGNGAKPAIAVASTVFDFSNAAAGIIAVDIGSSGAQTYANALDYIRVQRSINETKGSGGIGIRTRAITGVDWQSVVITGFDINLYMGTSATVGTVTTQVKLNNCSFLNCATMTARIDGVYEWFAYSCQFGGSYGADYALFLGTGTNGLVSNATHFSKCFFIGPAVGGGTAISDLVRITAGFWHNFEECVFEQASQCGIACFYAADENITLINVNVRGGWTDTVNYGVRNLGPGRPNIHVNNCRLSAVTASFEYNLSASQTAISRSVVVSDCLLHVSVTTNYCVGLFYVKGARIRGCTLYTGGASQTISAAASTDSTHVSDCHSICTGGDANGFSLSGTNNLVSNNSAKTMS